MNTLSILTGSFNELVKALKTKIETDLESQSSLSESSVAEKIRAALRDPSSVCSKIKDVIKHDFGIDGTVNVTEQGGNVTKVVIGSGDIQQGLTTVNVNSTPITIQIQGDASGLNNTNGLEIAKRLVKAVEIAVSGVPKLSGFTVKSGSEDQNDVKDFLIQKLRDAGSENYAKLVKELKTNGVTDEVLKNANQLRSKLGEQSVRTAIANLVKTEFSDVQGVNDHNDVNVTQEGGGGNTVNVTLGTGSPATVQGKAATVKGTSPEVKIQIKADTSKTSIDSEKATKIAYRLAKSCFDAANKVDNANLVEFLLQKDFGIGESDTVNVELGRSNNEVQVKIGTNANNSVGSSQVKVEKVGESGSAQTIEIKIYKQGALPNADDIAKRLVKAVEIAVSWVPKLSGFTVKSGSEDQNDVKDFLIQKLSDAGSAEFKDLVKKLRSPGGITDSSSLTADALAGQGKGLNKDEVKTAIRELVKSIDSIEKTQVGEVEVENSNGNKVTVKVKNAQEQDPNDGNKGSSIVKESVEI